MTAAVEFDRHQLPGFHPLDEMLRVLRASDPPTNSLYYCFEPETCACVTGPPLSGPARSP